VSTSSIPVLSEEGKHTPYEERRGWEYYWLVDPLDGTKEFVKRSDEFTVNIALIKKNRPVFEGIGSYKLEDVRAIGQLVAGAGEFSDENKPLKSLIEAAVRLPVQQSFNKSPDQLNLVGSRSHGTEALSDFVEKMKQPIAWWNKAAEKWWTWKKRPHLTIIRGTCIIPTLSVLQITSAK
jgi:3'(2'), 5'-bisphosphate nucleotidase